MYVKCVNVNMRETRNQGYIGTVDRARVNLGHAEIIRDLRWSLKLFHDPVVPPQSARFSIYVSSGLLRSLTIELFIDYEDQCNFIIIIIIINILLLLSKTSIISLYILKLATFTTLLRHFLRYSAAIAFRKRIKETIKGRT